MIEKIKNKIVAIDEVLNNMPQNNARNKSKYITEVDKVKKLCIKEQDKVLIEIKKRYDSICDTVEYKEDELQNKAIDNIEQQLYFISELNSPVDKIGMTEILYRLNHFYKNNLNEINKDIIMAIDKFKEVGIVLDSDDFNYSVYGLEYMQNFFDTPLEETTTRKSLKSCFEKIYWQCPNLIKYIDINFRMLYRKNEKKFDMYANDQIKKAFIEQDTNREGILEKLYQLKLQKDELKNQNKYLVIKDFLDGNKKIDDYTEEKIKQLYGNLISKKTDDIKVYQTYNPELIKLSCSLKEYQQYSRFSYIIDAVKTIYKEKDKYKDITKNSLKEINKLESKTMKLNKKIIKLKKKDKAKFKLENLLLITNTNLLTLNKLYEELDKNKSCENIYNMIKPNDSLLDIFKFVFAHYDYLVEVIKDHLEENNENDILTEINGLKDFIYSPYNYYVGNMMFLDEFNIPMVISDHYKLLNINIAEENITSIDVDSIHDSIDKIILFEKLSRMNLSTTDIKFICEVNKKIKLEEYI